MKKLPANAMDALTASTETLSHVAFLANRLAKQLVGRDRAVAYQIKAAALSALVLNGAATPNGIGAGDTVGLDFLGLRLHCPVSHFTPTARAIIRHKSGSLAAVAPLRDNLNLEQLRSLACVRQRSARKRNDWN